MNEEIQRLQKDEKSDLTEAPNWEIWEIIRLAELVVNDDFWSKDVGRIFLASNTIQAKNGEIGKIEVSFEYQQFISSTTRKIGLVVKFGKRKSIIQISYFSNGPSFHINEFLSKYNTFEGTGLGYFLMFFMQQFGLYLTKLNPKITSITLSSTPQARDFYKKQGFIEGESFIDNQNNLYYPQEFKLI